MKNQRHGPWDEHGGQRIRTMAIDGENEEGTTEDTHWEEKKEDDAERADQKGDGKDKRRHIEKGERRKMPAESIGSARIE